MKYPTIETERLILRAFDKSDAKDVQRLAGEKEIADTTQLPHPYEDGMAEKWISNHKSDFNQRKGVVFAITKKTTCELIGAISFMDVAKGHQAELGYWIGHPFWNLGFCTEAGQGIIDYAFSVYGLIRVHARHLSRNKASGKVLQSLGMKHEGIRKKHVVKWGKLEDVELYGILKEDWLNHQANECI